MLDSKPGKESREDESDEPAFLARQPEHQGMIMPQPRAGSKWRMGFAGQPAA